MNYRLLRIVACYESLLTGAELGFSRGGCGFLKIDFRNFGQIFCAAIKILKKDKKAFLGSFWKMLTKNGIFLARSPLHKFVEKILKMNISK